MFPRVQTWQLKGYSCSTSMPCFSCGIQTKVLGALVIHQSKKKMRLLRIKTCNTWAGRNLKESAKRLWNTNQEKNITFSSGEGVLFCQKSLFLVFKIGELRWTAMCSLLWVYYRVIFYGAEGEGTKSLWGTDSPLNLQKMLILSIMARSCWPACVHSVNED